MLSLKDVSLNDGECPCHNTGVDKKCPCSDYRENDTCHCGLYVKGEEKCLPINIENM